MVINRNEEERRKRRGKDLDYEESVGIYENNNEDNIWFWNGIKVEGGEENNGECGDGELGGDEGKEKIWDSNWISRGWGDEKEGKGEKDRYWIEEDNYLRDLDIYGENDREEEGWGEGIWRRW